MDNYSSIVDILVTKKKKLWFLNLFLIGFVVYTLAYTLSTTTLVNYIICQLFQIVGIGMFTLGAILLCHFRFDNKYLKIIFSLYCFWTVTIILRATLISYDEFKISLFDAWFGIFPYFTPLILLFPKNIVFYKRAFSVIIILAIFYIIYDGFFIRNLLDSDISNLTNLGIVEYFTKALAIPCGFLLLTYKYHSKKVNLLGIGITMLSIFFAVVRARRGLILISFGPLFFLYILYMMNSQKKFLMISVSVVFAFLIAVYGIIAFNSGIFNSVKKRGLEDTRGGVENSFYKDMSTSNWLIGKGLNGKYYAPGIDSDLSIYRETIETDYLQIILKGGLISLTLLLLITVPAAIKGIFYSKNQLSKAAGIWILIFLLSLYPANVTTFSMTYLLVWISVGICYSETIRNIPERVMRHYFQSRIE